MGTKNNPGKFDCYANADPDEPMFVLLARDLQAPSFVRAWSAVRQVRGESASVVIEAVQCAMAMEVWQAAHGREPTSFMTLLPESWFDTEFNRRGRPAPQTEHAKTVGKMIAEPQVLSGTQPRADTPESIEADFLEILSRNTGEFEPSDDEKQATIAGIQEMIARARALT